MIRLISLILVLSFSSTVFSADEKWYEGGTLHQKTLKEWHKATYKNKTATASDLVMAFPDIKKHIVAGGNIELAKIPAVSMAICIDTVAQPDKTGKIVDTSVAETAMGCGVLMGWKISE